MEETRNFTDGDLAALVNALHSVDHRCRYDVPPEELREMIRFVRNWNQALENGKGTIVTTILVLLVTGLVGLLGMGTYLKIKGG